MSGDKESMWRVALRELLTTLAREVAELIPGLVLRWARRRWGVDPLDPPPTINPTAEDDQ